VAWVARSSQEDFLATALAIVAESGVSAVTVASVSERLGSPTGSFYHRFASRDVLLGSLWLRAVLDFQTGINAALDADDGLRAALRTLHGLVLLCHKMSRLVRLVGCAQHGHRCSLSARATISRRRMVAIELGM
jgi:AcrR family transcriptional regulator